MTLEFTQAITEGRIWEPEDGEARLRLLASELLDMLRAATEGKPHPRTGIRLRNVDISGRLDLSTFTPLMGNHGGVQLENCSFDEEVRADRSHFRRLALINCRFPRFRARDSVFESGLDLRGSRACTKTGGGTECSIDLTNSRLEGDLLIGNAHLTVGPIREREHRSPGAGATTDGDWIIPQMPFALNLRGAEVHGTVRMEPNFRANGGVNLEDATVGGDLRARGARLCGIFGPAFRAKNATIRGLVLLSSGTSGGECASKTFPFIAIGRNHGALMFQNARMGRLVLSGARVYADGSNAADAIREPNVESLTHLQNNEPLTVQAFKTPRDLTSQLALDLTSATLDAGITTTPETHPDRTTALFIGGVCLKAARIRGDVVFSGSRIDTRHTIGSDLNQLPYAFDATGAEIHGSLRTETRFRAYGGMRIADAQITGDVFLQGAILVASRTSGRVFNGSEEHRIALRGRNTNVGGVLRLGGGVTVADDFRPFTCFGSVSLPNSVMDKLDMGGACLRNCEVKDGPSGSVIGLNLESARIRGGLHFNIVRTRTQTPHHPRLEGLLNLVDCRILGDVEADLWRMPVPSANRPASSPPPDPGTVLETRVRGEGVHVDGDLKLRIAAPFSEISREGDPSPFYEVRLAGARIGRGLFITSGRDLRVDARGVVSGGDFRCYGRLFSEEGLENFPRLVLHADAARVDGDFRLFSVEFGSPPSRHASDIHAPDTALHRTSADDSSSHPDGWRRPTSGRGLSVKGDFEILSCRFTDRVEFDRTQIGGSMILNDLLFKTELPVTPPDGASPGQSAPRSGGPGRHGHSGLFLDGSQIAGHLKARAIQWRQWRADKQPLPAERHLDEALRTRIGLTFVRAKALDDLGGRVWHPMLKLHLRGFVYDALYLDRDDYRQNRSAVPVFQPDPVISELRKRSRNAVRSLLLIATLTLLAGGALWYLRGAVTLRPLLFTPFILGLAALVLPPTTVLLPRAFGALDLGGRSIENQRFRFACRMAWLRQQYDLNPRKGERYHTYFSQPYVQLSQIYRAQGQFREERDVLIERIWQEILVRIDDLWPRASGPSPVESNQNRRLMQRLRILIFRTVLSIARFGRYWFVKMLLLGLAAAYFVVAGFGLKVSRAIISLAALLLFGVALGLAEHRSLEPNLECRTAPFVASRIVAHGPLNLLRDQSRTPCAAADEAPRSITIFAAGDSQQFETSSPAPKPSGWWLIWLGYALVGWLFVSLAILTPTGLIRRFVAN